MDYPPGIGSIIYFLSTRLITDWSDVRSRPMDGIAILAHTKCFSPFEESHNGEHSIEQHKPGIKIKITTMVKHDS